MALTDQYPIETDDLTNLVGTFRPFLRNPPHGALREMETPRAEDFLQEDGGIRISIRLGHARDDDTTTSSSGIYLF